MHIFSYLCTEGVDYVLSHPTLSLLDNPIPVTVTLLNDGVNDEQPETITLTLMQDGFFDSNQILVYDTVQITLQDSDSK